MFIGNNPRDLFPSFIYPPILHSFNNIQAIQAMILSSRLQQRKRWIQRKGSEIASLNSSFSKEAVTLMERQQQIRK
jgi:hypothetical protein